MISTRHTVITVAAAGTRQQIPTVSGSVVGLVLQAHTGTIYVGGSTVSSTDYGLKLVAANNAQVVIDLGGQPIDLNSIYIDAGTNADKLAVLYFVKVSR